MKSDIYTNRNFKPMLLKEIAKPFNSKDYIFEMKFDGIRALIFTDGDEFYIQSRNVKDITYMFPELKPIKNLVKSKVIFDGEIVAFDKNAPSFSKLQERLHLKDLKTIKLKSDYEPVFFIVFDILYEGTDLTSKSLIDRKNILKKYKDCECFYKCKYIENNGIELFNKIKRNNLEGIVAKKKNAAYLINKRSDNYIKIKNIKDGKFYICGYSNNKDNNSISIILCKKAKDEFLYVGKVKLSSKYKLFNKIKKLKIINNYVVGYSDFKCVKPIYKCLVNYLEITKSGHLRHGIFKEEV